MKTLEPALASHLTQKVTTLANCWRLTRRDGTVLGFTDHDRPLVISGVTYDAVAGLGTSETVASADLSVGGGEIMGALSSAAITDADISRGAYDGATIDVFLVNWADVGQILHQRSGVIGEVTRRDGSFVAEVRSLADALDQERGRIYQHRCDADLGDGRCGIDLASAGYRGSGTIVAVESRTRFSSDGLGTFAAGWFQRGRLGFASGANAGSAFEVKIHRLADGIAQFELWQPAAAAIAVGDAFVVSAGCDKLIDTCDQRFGNALNFRGFPHIPGSDYLLAHPALTALPNDGKALVA
ncbi:MAG: DUF2163 domain-containing protein [Ancalomicrobiaceae bacterium]|nr:DUF2163 domain-containing protein [Ancalomicrobiaceae bacterium]